MRSFAKVLILSLLILSFAATGCRKSAGSSQGTQQPQEDSSKKGQDKDKDQDKDKAKDQDKDKKEKDKDDAGEKGLLELTQEEIEQAHQRDLESYEAAKNADLFRPDQLVTGSRPIHTTNGVRFAFYKVLGDGDCAFHAVDLHRGPFLNRVLNRIDQNDTSVVNHMKVLMAIDELDPRDESVITTEDIKEYIRNRMSDQGYYLQVETIGLAAQLYGKKVRVWKPTAEGSEELDLVLESDFGKPTEKYINLLFNRWHGGNHYDLLVEEKDEAGRSDASFREFEWTQRYLKSLQEQADASLALLLGESNE